MSHRPKLIAGVDLDSWMGGEGDVPPSTPEGAVALRSLFGKEKAPILVTSDLKRHERIKNSGRYVAPPGADAPPGEVVPQIWPTLAGQPVNNRGNRLSIDTTQITTGTTKNIPVLQILSRGADAQMLTAMLGFSLPAPLLNLAAPAVTTVIADLRWGTGNVQYAAQVDWLAGTMISLPATFLSINAIVPGNSAVVGAKSQMPNFELGAALAYGVAGEHRNRTKLTVPIGALANGAISTAVPIPPFAVGFGLTQSVAVLGTPPPTPIYLRTQAPGTTQIADFVYATADNFGWQESAIFPIRNGVTEVVVRNGSGVNLVNLALLFDLAF